MLAPTISMDLLFSLIYWETLLLLLCAFGMVVVLMLTGEIQLDRLFYGRKKDGSTYYSPERVQLFLVTLGVAFQFLSAVLLNPTKFPDVPASWLAVLGGSHFLYLGGKTAAAFLGKAKSS